MFTQYLKVLSSITISLVLLLLFQNCSAVKFTSDGQQVQTKQMMAGNGGPYEGKPGNYYRPIPGHTCEESPAFHSVLQIQPGNIASVTYNYPTQCGVVKQPKSLQDMDIVSLNGDIIAYREGIYRRSTDDPLNYHSPIEDIEVYCQDIHPYIRSVEAIIKYNPNTYETTAKLYFGNIGKPIIEYTIRSIARNAPLPFLNYRGENLALSVDTSQFVSGKLQIFHGELKFFDELGLKPLAMNCRTGGSLDPKLILPPSGSNSKTFGVQGKTILSLPIVGGTVFHMENLADDKMLISLGKNLDKSFSMAKLNGEGSLDAQFGNNGFVNIPFANTAQANTFKTLQNGKIIVGGSVAGNWALVRLDSEGSLDSTFGNKGIIQLDLGGPDDTISDLTILTNGNIIASGVRGDRRKNTFLTIAQWTPDGQLISGFGSGGILNLEFGRSSGMALTQDGKFVVGTSLYKYSLYQRFVISKFDQKTGQIDRSFGPNNQGYASFEFPEPMGTTSWLDTIEVLKSGKILIAGRFSGDYGVAQFLPNGLPNLSFGINGGSVTNGWLSDYLHDLVIQPDGKIIILGGHDGSGPHIVRLDDDGQKDLSYGVAGVTRPNDDSSTPTSSAESPREPKRGFITKNGQLRFVSETGNGNYIIYELNN